jgi:multiple sugar transport system substrate-binding protein
MIYYFLHLEEKMRKNLVMAIGILAIAAGTVFAGGQSENDGAAVKSVKLVSRDSTGYTNFYTNGINDFNSKYTDAVASFEILPGSEADYDTKTALMLQSDDNVDVMNTDSFLVPSLVASGVLSPLPVDQWDEWESQYSQSMRDSMKVDGEVYGVFFCSDTRGLFYSIDLFKKAGIETPWQPKNWQELKDAIAKLDSVGVEYPFWINGSKSQGEATTMQTFEMLLSGTDDWLMEGDKWVINSKGFEDSLQFIQDLADSGIYSNNDLAEMLDTNAYRLVNEKMMTAGEIGILLDGNWKGGDFVAALGEDAPNSIGVAAMPRQNGNGFTSMSGGWVFTIPTLSKNKAEAFDLIKEVSSYKNSLDLAKESSQMTVRNDVMENEEYKNINYYTSEMSHYIDFTKFRPGNELYPSVSVEIQNAVESVITGRTTAKEAAELYSENVKKIVGEEACIEK